MTHGYSLRPNAKGRREHQSTDDPDGQVEGSSTGDGHDLTDDQCPAAPKAAAHNTPVLAQGSAHQRTEEDQRRSRCIPSTIVGNTTHLDPGRLATRSQLETSEEIRKGREREEKRRRAAANRIRCEQIVLGYERDMSALRARIMELRREREEKVEQVRRKWERAHGIEQGGVAVTEEDGEVVEGSEAMEVENDYAHTEASLAVNTDEDGRWQQQRWPSRPPSHWSHRSETPPVQTGSRQSQQLSPRIGETFPSSGMAGPSQLEPGVMEQESWEARQGQGLVSQSRPQPLRRQRAQLVMIPTPTTGVLDPENSFCGTDGDKDSEMGE